jgi:hypothetical protein
MRGRQTLLHDLEEGRVLQSCSHPLFIVELLVDCEKLLSTCMKYKAARMGTYPRVHSGASQA